LHEHKKELIQIQVFIGG